MAKRMKTTTKLTIESERAIVCRTRRVASQEWCTACNEIVPLITAAEGAALLRVSPPAVYRMIEAQKLHVTRSDEGVPLICFKSLSRRLSARAPETLKSISKRKGETDDG